jgi:hypothetical protein
MNVAHEAQLLPRFSIYGVGLSVQMMHGDGAIRGVSRGGIDGGNDGGIDGGYDGDGAV